MKPLMERVLVLPRDAVPGGCDFLGVKPIDDADLEGLRRALETDARWLDRDSAEQDSSHKQLIPYVVVRDTDQVFLMERTNAGGDPRLHRRATIGVGGHLNPVDDGPDPLGAGLRREWREELDAGWEPEFTPIGFLNDDRNPVGSVHLGIVFEVQAAGRPIDVRERTKLSGHLASLDELRLAWDRLETWSQLVAEALWGRLPR
ncbi:MAG: NUDIX hydrolase [Chloroflexota bacterium]